MKHALRQHPVSAAFTLIELPVVSRKPNGFTIVELLVVITIIIVLLALLTPALDKVMYQAKLTVCGTKEKAIVIGSQTYAFDNKRYYPHYRAGTPNSAAPEDSRFAPPIINYKNGYDWRPVLRQYLSLNTALVDDLAGDIDIESAGQFTLVFSTYNLWFGFDYAHNDAGHEGQRDRGRMKVGDKLIWNQHANPNPGVRRFNTMVADRDINLIGLFNTRVRGTSHPDLDGMLNNIQVHDTTSESGAPETPASTAQTHAEWNRTAGALVVQSIEVDLNHAMEDGSVELFTEVVYGDERMGKVPWLQTSGSAEGSYLQIANR